MTIKEFYEKAISMGKENCEMIVVKMGKDRKNRWLKVKPRYGIKENVVFMEISSEVQNDMPNV